MLGLELVVSPTGLEQGLVNFCTGQETNMGLVVFRRVPNDGGVGSGCPGERTMVTDLLLNVANDHSFRKLADRENIPYVEGSFLATADEGTGVKALSGNEGLLELVTIRITEDDTGKWSTTMGSTNFSDPAY